MAGHADAKIEEGTAIVLEARSMSEPFTAVFEDDGDTGYFYALDLRGGHAAKIVDGVQIYSVGDGTGTRTRAIRLEWSADGWRAGLRVDGVLEAVLDFARQRGMCRTGFPPARDPWTRQKALSDHELIEALSARAV